MTRGTAWIIGENVVYFSEEFNGDMYLQGNGFDFIKHIENVNTDANEVEESFSKEMNEFNEENFGYEEYENGKIKRNSYKTLDVRKGNYRFSDFNYFLNSTKLDIDLLTEEGVHVLKAGQLVVVNYGRKVVAVIDDSAL